MIKLSESLIFCKLPKPAHCMLYFLLNYEFSEVKSVIWKPSDTCYKVSFQVRAHRQQGAVVSVTEIGLGGLRDRPHGPILCKNTLCFHILSVCQLYHSTIHLHRPFKYKLH